jgi:hypothetical protein
MGHGAFKRSALRNDVERTGHFPFCHLSRGHNIDVEGSMIHYFTLTAMFELAARMHVYPSTVSCIQAGATAP